MLSKSLHARLVAYEPFGQRIGVLPQPTSFDVSLVHNDDGALNLTYSRKALGGSILSRTLEQGLEIALEVSDGGRYVEPDNARYLVIARKNDSTDESDTVTISSAPSISWLLSKTLNNDTSHLIADGDNKGKRAFLSKTPGAIVKTMMTENRERGGAATGLALGFDTGKDSAGTSWQNVYTLYYSLGVSVQATLASLVGGGGLDWRTSGRTLKMWNPDSTSLSRDLSGRVNLRFRRDVAEAPNEESISELASDILVEGDNGLIFRETNAAAPTPWGKWESYVSQGGVSDKATARAFMQATLEASARVRGQYTRSLNIYDVDILPLFDYHVGDWITAPTVKHGEKVRIQEIDISFDATSGLTASVMLNDLKLDAAVKANKKIQGITGGATLAGSEGGRPAPEKDHRVPKAVTGLVVQTDAYISSSGAALGLATLQWAAVSQATDNTAIDISGYRVEYRKNLAGAPWVSGGVTDAQRLTLGIGGLECGQRYEFRVRAVPTYSDKLGDWSNAVVALVASDVTPPSIPSKPILTSKLGVMDVQWDGENNVGGGMEPDFDHVEVGISDSNGNWKYRDSVARDGHCIVTGLEYRAYWFALRSVDHSGNKSDWGVGASITVASAVSQADLDRLDKDLAVNKKEMEQARKDIVSNQTEISNANRRIDTNKTDIAHANKELAQARQDIAQANRELDAAQGDISQAKKDITQAKSDAANAKTEAGKASAAIESAKTDIANAASKAQSALDKANSVGKSLDGLHNVHEGPDDPTTLSGVTVRQGDFWYRTQKLSSRFIGVYVWDGSAWNERNLVASNILASGSVVASNMAANSITTEKLVAGAITTDKVAANAIVAGKIAAGAISTDKLAALAVTADKLAAKSVVAGKLAANAVTAETIAAGAVVAGKLAANSVAAGNIVSGAVTADKLAANSVNASKIVAGAVTADKLAANSVNASKIAAQSITGDRIASNTIVARNIAAQSITSDRIAAGQFTGYVFTGAVFQSSTEEDTGWKLQGNTLEMYNSQHRRTVLLDGEGESNLVTGTFQTALDGNRMKFSPNFQQTAVAGGEQFEGTGIQFYHGTEAFAHPYLAIESTTSVKGEVSAITMNGGHRIKNDPGAWFRLGETKTDDGATKAATCLLYAQKDYDAPQAQATRAQIEAWSPQTGDTYLRAIAKDPDSTVGIEANASTRNLHFGGYLGYYTGMGTLMWAHWKAFNAGQFKSRQYSHIRCTTTPAKYGAYQAVANSDTSWAGVYAHVENTHSASGWGIVLLNLDTDCNDAVYIDTIGWLRS